MNAAVDRNRFERELAGWAVRGVLCAVPSAGWAFAAEFNCPAEYAAMTAGTAVWIAAFAGFSAWEAMQATAGRERFMRALKMAAGIKAALLVGVAIAWASAAGLKTPVGLWLGLGVFPDVWAGLGSVWLVSQPAGVGESLSLGQLNSFGWTLATTLVQGALISVPLVTLALGVLGWWRFGPRVWRQLKLSPAPYSG